MTTPATLPAGAKRPLRRITVHAAAAIVAADYGIPLSDLVGQSRKGDLIEPRQVAMWVGLRHLRRSLGQVGLAIGGRDHSTVLYGARKIEGLRETDPAFAGRLTRLTRRVDAAGVELAARADEMPPAAPVPPPPALTPEVVKPEPPAQGFVRTIGPSPRERRVCEAAGRFLQANDRLQRSLYTPGERAARQDTTAALECLREAYGAPASHAESGR